MVVDQTILSVHDLRELALPLGTTVSAGGEGMQRPVRWAITVQGGAPPPHLEGDELILIIPGENDTMPTVRACIEAKVAAIALPPPVTPLVLAMADQALVPILQLPPDTRIRETERVIIGLLLDRQSHLERRSTQLYQQLVRLASENVGLDQIIHELARYSRKTVVVQDKHLRIKVSAVSPELSADWDKIAEQLIARQALPNTLVNRHKLPRHTEPGVVQQLSLANGSATHQVARLVTPIVNTDVGRGFLSFIASGDDPFDEIDRVLIGHAAVICALEMARAKAMNELEKKLRGDFLTNLMTGTVSELEATAEGDRFRHDMSAPHVALVMMWYGSHHPSPRRLETLVNGLLAGRQVQALAQLRESEFRMFYTSDAPDLIKDARQLADLIWREAKREFPNAQLTIGIGKVVNRVNDWRSSYREAAQAADIGRRLRTEVSLYIGDLGIYNFLSRPDLRDDLTALRDNTIGSLLKLEEKQRADLLSTLEAFFQCHGNLTQTAEMLSVHRNTLFYRMNRIVEITKLDLNQPDVRLAVHLALKIHRLVTAET